MQMRKLLQSAALERFSLTSMQAVSALAAFDDDESAKFLAQLARGKDDNTARGAIVGLAYMCGPLAASELQEIARELPSRNSFVLDQIKKGDSLKSEIRQCERRKALVKTN